MPSDICWGGGGGGEQKNRGTLIPFGGPFKKQFSWKQKVFKKMLATGRGEGEVYTFFSKIEPLKNFPAIILR
jgi:hypothetical protein